MIRTDPALRTLARLKFRGALRKTVKRMKTFSGIVFMTIGIGMASMWVLSLYITGTWKVGVDPIVSSDLDMRAMMQLTMAFFTVVSLSSAANVRGLYLPKNEIETLFAAPVSRQQLVRYRMAIDARRTLIGGTIFGLVLMRKAEVPLFGLLGTMLAMLTLVTVRQAVSLMLADAEDRFGHIFRPRIMKFVAIFGGIGIWVFIMTFVMGDDFLGDFLGVENSTEVLSKILAHPVVQALMLPFYPQASMITAASFANFALWTSVCVAIYYALFEVTARLPIDFREQSLQTSQNIADKLARVKRGGVFSGDQVDRRVASKRVPWFFGRGPYGAVAWAKTTEIVRKGQRGLFASLFVVGMVAAVITFATKRDDDLARSVAPMIIAVLSVLYLSGGLRVDFRSELDRMERIKGWPLNPARLFSAILMPQVMAISIFVTIALVGRAALLNLWHPVILACVIVLPFCAFTWMSVDNLVFLFKPVRFVPGQEGTLHHTGRALVLLLLRLVTFGVVLGLISVCGLIAVWSLDQFFEVSQNVLISVVVAVSLPLFAIADWALCLVGGLLIQRFDVSRDLG